MVESYPHPTPTERRKRHLMVSQLLAAQYDGITSKKIFPGKFDLVVAPLSSSLDGLFSKTFFFNFSSLYPILRYCSAERAVFYVSLSAKNVLLHMSN